MKYHVNTNLFYVKILTYLILFINHITLNKDLFKVNNTIKINN